MSKVLTVRLDNDLYKRLKSQSRPTRELVTKAIGEYLSKLECKTETKVYGAYTGLNRKKIPDDYESICKWLDSLTGAENDNKD